MKKSDKTQSFFGKALMQGLKNAADRRAALFEIDAVMKKVQSDVLQESVGWVRVALTHSADPKRQWDAFQEGEAIISYVSKNGISSKIASLEVSKMGYPVTVRFPNHEFICLNLPMLEEAFVKLLSNVSTGLIAKSLMEPERFDELTNKNPLS